MSRQAGGQNYDFTVPANGSFPIEAVGSYFRIISSGGALTVRMNGTSSLLKGMIAGQGVQGQDFLSLELFNTTGAAISGVMFVGDGGFFDLNLSVTGGIAVRPEPISGAYFATTTLAANTADPVFLAAANTNGAIIELMQSRNYSLNGSVEMYIAKNGTPANTTDGTQLAMCREINAGVSNTLTEIYTEKSVFVPSGQGVYFISSLAMVASYNTPRLCRYKLL